MQRGTETRNHMQMRANIVPKGTAAEEPAETRKKFRMMKTPKRALDRGRNV